MDIVNKTVTHQSFGKGKVCEVADNIISVQFGEGTKRFIFPDAFRTHLSFSDSKSRKYIDSIFEEMDEELRIRSENAEQELKKERILQSLPLSTTAQAAIRLTDERQFLRDWTVSAGSYLSGPNKGQPRTPAMLYPNSACLLTFGEKGKPEEERRILGFFMVQAGFIGAQCTDGLIAAHEKYRITLTPQEQENTPWLKYFGGRSPDQGIKWGSLVIKPFSNVTMARIIHDILAGRADTEDETLCQEFLDYFCKLNKINKKELSAK